MLLPTEERCGNVADFSFSLKDLKVLVTFKMCWSFLTWVSSSASGKRRLLIIEWLRLEKTLRSPGPTHPHHCPSLHGSRTHPRMVVPPPPWAACAGASLLFQRSFPNIQPEWCNPSSSQHWDSFLPPKATLLTSGLALLMYLYHSAVEFVWVSLCLTWSRSKIDVRELKAKRKHSVSF